MEESCNLQKIFGEYLEKMGSKHKNMIVLDTDLSNGLNTLKFAKNFPDRHHSICGSEICALNMAGGFQIRKKIPFVCGKGINLTGKGFEAIRNNIALNQMNIKIIASGCGLSMSEQGNHECALEDLNALQSISEITIFSPADPLEMKGMMEEMILNYGVYYLRLGKTPLNTLFGNNYSYKSNKAQIIKNGEQICIFATGPSVQLALEASSELEKRGISIQIVNISTINPLDNEMIDSCAENFNLLVSIEEHSSFGGMGSKILHRLNNTIQKKLLILGTETIQFSGNYNNALFKQKLDIKSIYEQIRNTWISN